MYNSNGYERIALAVFFGFFGIGVLVCYVLSQTDLHTVLTMIP